MSVKQRLIEFAKSQEKSVRAFEIKCGLTIGYINAIRVSISPEKVQSIASYYPQLNASWLFTGEGSMLKNETKNDERIEISANETTKDYIETLKKIIKDQAETIKGLQRTIDNLQKQISEKNLASAVPEAGAECAAVG